MIEKPEIREKIRDAVSRLHDLDNRLATLAESLVLPSGVERMWELQIPMSFNANLYAALDAVRTDCIQDAVETLLNASRQSDDSLYREWTRGHH